MAFVLTFPLSTFSTFEFSTFATQIVSEARDAEIIRF